MLTDYIKSNRNGQSGIDEIYIGGWAKNITHTYGTNSLITGGNLTGITFSTIEQEYQHAGFSYTSTIDDNNKLLYYTSTVTAMFHKLTPELLNNLRLMGIGKWVIILKSKKGDYWLIPTENPVTMTVNEGGLGKEANSLDGANLSFVTEASELPIYKIDSTFAASVLA